MSTAAEHAAPGRRPRGRPRSTTRHHAILESTRTLLTAGTYEQLTIEAIAAAAGVSKQTVYKWWPSKAAVVTEAVIAGCVTVAVAAPADSGDVSADLRSWLTARFVELEDSGVVALIRAMTVASAEGTDSQRIYDSITEPHRAYLLRRLTTAAEAGELRHGVDLDAAADAILGTLLLQSLRHDAREGAHRADGFADLLLTGLLRPRDT